MGLAVQTPYLCFGELFEEPPVVVAWPMLATRSAEAGSASAASMLAIGGVAWVDVWKGEMCGLTNSGTGQFWRGCSFL